MPPPRTLTDEEEILDVLPVMNGWVRGVLVGLVLAMTAVFGVALWLNPYESDGTARRLETHRQFGLPRCTFYEVTGVPCPSCGMTTSFALLVRGDLLNSLRANAAGTVLALFCLAVIPWGVVSLWRQRTLFIRSLEATVVIVVTAVLGLMMVRWALVVGWTLWIQSH